MTRHRRLLWVIVGAALAVRVGFVLWYPQVPVTGDAGAYEFEASHLASGTGRVMQRLTTVEIAKGPGYPVFLAAIYRLWGRQASAVRVAQALLSTYLVVLVALLAQAVVQQPSAVLIAAALAAGYPPFISYPGLLLKETLSAFLLAAFVCLMMRATTLRGWIAAGVVAALMVLTRSELAAIVLVCAGLTWKHVGVRQAATLLLVATLLVLPWTLRNYLVFRRVIPISAEAGSVVWASNYVHDQAAWDDPRYHALVAGRSALDTQTTLLREGLKTMMTHPLAYLQVCLKRLPRSWVGSHSDTFIGLEEAVSVYLQRGNLLRVGLKFVLWLSHLAIVVLGFLGAYLAWKLQQADPYLLHLIMGVVVSTVLMHFFLFTALRHQVPVMPLLIVLAAFAIGHARSVVGAVAPVQAS